MGPTASVSELEGGFAQDVCPCGTGHSYSQCCEPCIRGIRRPLSAEELMRSRYSAYVKAEVEYVMQSTHPEKRGDCDEKAIRSWALNSTWEGLEILGTNKGTDEDLEGTVEFKAHFTEDKIKKNVYENAFFVKLDGKWYYSGSEQKPLKPFIRTEEKVSRNDTCPCGSGKKYKKCCAL